MVMADPPDLGHGKKVFTPGRLGTFRLAQVEAYLAVFVSWEFNWSRDFKMTLDYKGFLTP